MKNIKKYLLLLTLTGLLTNCDPGTTNKYFIENNSGHEILVNYRNWEYDTVIPVPPEINQLIFAQFRIGLAGDSGKKFLNWSDTLSLTINDSLKIKKDYLDRSNWSLQIIEGDDGLTDGGESIYTFTIENEDIEN
jgi:hypothetical protein